MSNYIKPLIGVCAAVVLTGCIEKEKIVTIPDAENILFTTQGDLLVTGGKSIYQVTSSLDETGRATYEEESIYEGRNCAFAGIAQSGDWVYSVCAEIRFEWKGFTFRLVKDNHLLAANLQERPLNFVKLDAGVENDPLDSVAIPNGLAFAPDGKLLIADENFFAQSSVGRISLDYSGTTPTVSNFEPDWLGDEYGIQSPNGVRVADNKLYVSDGNKVRRFEFDDNSNIPLIFTNNAGEEVSNLPDDNELYSGSIIIDDIMPYCGGIAVTHYLEGQLVYQSASGEKYSTLPFSLESPSALAVGQGQGFNGSDLMVTEKGIILEHSSSIGNQLTRVPIDFDLSDPNTCAAIGESSS